MLNLPVDCMSSESIGGRPALVVTWSRSRKTPDEGVRSERAILASEDRGCCEGDVVSKCVTDRISAVCWFYFWLYAFLLILIYILFLLICLEYAFRTLFF